MKQCKVIYVDHWGTHESRAEQLETKINSYLEQGYEIKAVTQEGECGIWFVFLEKDI